MKELLELIKKLAVGKYYGELTIKFEHGKVVFAKKTETIKFH